MSKNKKQLSNADKIAFGIFLIELAKFVKEIVLDLLKKVN